MAKPAQPNIPAPSRMLSLKVTLRNIRPPIWRRILLPAEMTLASLHWAIQAAMGWTGGHLHGFEAGGNRYGETGGLDDFDDGDVIDESRLRLSALVKSGVTRFSYTYDFGDDWEHTILIEKAPPAGAAGGWPACVAGKRNCPPEDCGGPWGYAELLQILADPGHPRHAEQVERVDGFDPESFSVAEANRKVAGAFGLKVISAS